MYECVSKLIRYDDLDFLGDDVIDEKTLKDDLGIADEAERDAIWDKVSVAIFWPSLLRIITWQP